MEAELLEGAVVESESTEELLRERKAFDRTRGLLFSVDSGCSGAGAGVGVGAGAASREMEEALRLHRSTLIVYRPGELRPGRMSSVEIQYTVAQLKPMQSLGAR